MAPQRRGAFTCPGKNNSLRGARTCCRFIVGQPFKLEVIKAACWGFFAAGILAALIVIGSRNLSHFDAALVGYTFAVLFATFGIVYRYAMWLQRPPTFFPRYAYGQHLSTRQSHRCAILVLGAPCVRLHCAVRLGGNFSRSLANDSPATLRGVGRRVHRSLVRTSAKSISLRKALMRITLTRRSSPKRNFLP